jgi:uncharacterized repeat protein (TIGR03803 family)
MYDPDSPSNRLLRATISQQTSLEGDRTMPRSARIIVIGLTVAVLSTSLAAAQTGTATLQRLLTFTGSNGGQPVAAPIVDQAGNLYGTTSEGGVGKCSVGKWTLGCGTVYKLSPPSNGSTQWNETLLYQFRDVADGEYPVGGVVFDKTGNLYGTTLYGGGSASACGTVFELTPPASGSGPWTKMILYKFTCGADGGYPESGQTFDKAGNLYGTASWGGVCNNSYGCGGVVYELSPPTVAGDPWTETVLYTFLMSADGARPQSTPLFDASGKLYGTTILGGSAADCGLTGGCGTIFQLTPSTSGGSWTEKVLYTFGSQPYDGLEPRSGLVFAKPGIFYGVTELGGTSSRGTVYQLTAPASSGGSWSESILYSFGGSDGSGPFGAPALGTDGSIYGLTMFGGNDQGNVFQLAPPAVSGDPWTETSLYSFNSQEYPVAGLTLGKGGWLYGTTTGGVEQVACATSKTGQNIGCGEVFRILP